mmetsp:Transcript_5526/g.16494  ORF Transcript_5526/g.16494 Transcript_5526/m.16494 type:complete len:423 (-) Transcript_5526:88-1356(-)
MSEDTAGKQYMYTWGRAKNFRLGRATDTYDVKRPEKVTALAGVRVKQAACGGGHTCVVLEDERLFVFGYSQYGQVGLGDRVDVSEPSHVKILDDRQLQHCVVQVACGRYHTVALTATGEVYTWGGGKNGRLGHGDEKIRTTPSKVTGFRLPVRSVACGYHSSVAITDDGVYTWGWGAHGQLGHGDSNDRLSPYKMDSIRDKIVAITCGDRHGFALSADGSVHGWGSNEFNQLGIGRRGDVFMTARPLSSLSGLIIKAISSGDRHSAALTNLGVVYTWGCGTDGQCGHGAFQDSHRPRAVTSIPLPVVDIVCGHNFTMALASDRTVFAWGNNTYGQLGCDAPTSAVAVPTRIAIDVPVRGLTCGHFHGVLWVDTTQTRDRSEQDGSSVPQTDLIQQVPKMLEKLNEDKLARMSVMEQLGKLCV